MGRRARGTITERPGKGGIGYLLRFPAYGGRESVTLSSRDGYTRTKAEVELQNILADVRRGTWRPDPPPVPKPPDDPTFHEFSSEWLAARHDELRPNTRIDYRWQLTDHLLPFFADHRLSQIDVREVDRYRQFKVREARLSPNSINKTLTRLGQILEVALEYGLVEVNAARVGGKRRRLRPKKPPQTYRDRAEQITALLEAAGELELEARHDRKLGRRALLTTLIFTGVRIGEALAVRVRDVGLASGRLRIPDAKTPAGVRYVDLLPIVREELAAHKATLRDTNPDAFMFPTRTGRQQGRDNARNRIFASAVTRADEKLTAAGLTPLPERLTPHSLRRTCCSLRVALGEDIAYVAEQLGHAETTVTHRIYTRVMRMDAASRESLRRLVHGEVLEQIGTNPTDHHDSDGTSTLATGTISR